MQVPDSCEETLCVRRAVVMHRHEVDAEVRPPRPGHEMVQPRAPDIDRGRRSQPQPGGLKVGPQPDGLIDRHAGLAWVVRLVESEEVFGPRLGKLPGHVAKGVLSEQSIRAPHHRDKARVGRDGIRGSPGVVPVGVETSDLSQCQRIIAAVGCAFESPVAEMAVRATDCAEGAGTGPGGVAAELAPAAARAAAIAVRNVRRSMDSFFRSEVGRYHPQPDVTRVTLRRSLGVWNNRNVLQLPAAPGTRQKRFHEMV